MAATLVLLVDSPKIHYNTRFRVLICEPCHACIDPTHAENHFKKCHKHMKRKARLNVIDQLNEQIGTLQSAPELPKQVRRPRPLEIYFKLLAITQRIYFACNECDECITISEEWIRRHYNTEHQIKFTANDARPYWSELEVQTFFDQPKRFFIPNTEHNRQRMNNANRVLTNPNPTANIAAEAIGQSQVLRDNTLADFTEALRNAENQTNETFTEMDPKYLHQFVQNFRLHYWLNGKNVAQLAQLANKPSADDEQGQWIVSMGIQCWRVNEQQLDGLDRSFLQVVNTDIFHEDQNSEYTMRPFKSLQENSTKKRYSGFFGAWIYMTYQVWKKQEFAEWAESIVTILENIEQLGEACGWQVENVTDEQITTYQELVFQLVNKSLKERITLIEFTEVNLSPKFTNPLIIFSIAVAFDNTGAFRANQSLSNIYSAIIYSLRLMAIGYVLWKNNCRKLAGQAFDLQHYIQTYHEKYLNVNRFTVFGEIQHMRGYIRKAEKYHMKEGCIEDVESNVIRWNGEEIKIDELRKSIHQLIKDCEVLLYDELLYIHPDRLGAQVNVSSLKEDIRVRARGYWFRQNPKNQLDQYDTFLIKRFTDPETALGQSFSQRVNDRMQMKPLKINDWLRVRQQFIQTLGLLVHFSGGAPVRGSEILTVTFKNASTVQRGVFIEQGLKVVLLKTRYGKPSSMTGQDNPTIRVLSKRISQMLVHYLVIALPLYQYLMQKQHEANGEVYHISDVLFEINGKPMTNDALGRRLALHCKIHLHNSLGLLGWRHSAKYIIKTRVIRNTGIVLLSDSSSSDEGGGAKLQWIEDRQSNHTSWTAQLIYARNAELPTGTTENTYGNSLALSRKYQDFLQVEDAPCVIRRDPNPRKKGKHARQVSDLNNTAFSKRPKIMQSAMDQSLQGNTQSTKQLLANSLCEYFGSKRAKFRSSYQQEAIECVIDQHPSVLYVNGTNSGKSLTFFLPAFIEKRKYHVVLAPLVSLKGDLLERAKSANLNAAIWESSQEKTEKLMFVSFESIHQNPNWEKWIEAHRQEISRIYVDEAHTIISQSKWRYIMRYISELNLLKLPITFLTATLTLETQVLLFKEMELDEDTRVIRGPTKRGNIHYAVHFLKANETEDVHYKRVIDQYLTSLRNNNTLVTGDQVLIFISGSYGDIERMANEFGHEYYHSSRSDREAVLASFKNGEFEVLVSSSALGLGLDMPNIRCVIQIGFLSSVIDFSQESGRAGRDGKKAHSLIITPVNKNRAECATKRISYEPSELNWVLFQQIDKDNMSRFIYTSQCRRLLLNNAFDNLVNQQCDASEGDELCDLCANRQRITNERAQRENQKQALRLGNTIKLGELLDQLKNTCIWCVFVGNWDHIYAHSFNECTYQHLAGPPLRLGMRGQTSTYAEMKSWVFDIKRSIHNNRSIKEGYACYSCFLPMMFCAEPGEPCQKWKFSTNDVECEWKNIVIEFNVLMYNLHVTGRHDMHYETAIGSNHQLAKALVKNGIIHNTECIQGVIWLWELDWFEWVQKASGIITNRVSNAIEFESADQEEAIEISSEAGSEAGDEAGIEAGDEGDIEAGDEAGIEAGDEESSESEIIEDEISEKSVREEFPPDSDDSIISQFR